MTVNNNPNNYQPKTYTTTTPTPECTTPPPEECEEVKVSRELDGLNDTGIIGEMLTAGTQNLADANKYFAMSKFSVSGLLAEDNQAVSSQAAVTSKEGKTLCADDMYLAGDPGVGGKGNDYAYQHVEVDPGFYTMFEDGADGGPKITVNAHVEQINPEGSKAFTEYGFVVQDEQGAKTKATLSGGQLTIIDANGQSKKLLPGQEYYVGNPNDPTAKFYYADVPGAGENGATEKRLMVDYYEKPTQAKKDELIAAGADPDEVAQLRSRTTMSYGFRVPDGTNTYETPEGVGAGTAMKTAENGVKTYYDSHYSEGSCTKLDICPKPKPPVAPEEHARLWGDPHIEEADGGKYHFHETGIYNVLKDKDLELNSKLSDGPGKTTINTEAGLTIGGRTVHVLADGTTTIGYADPNIKAAAITLQDGQTVMLGENGSITRTGNKITVDSPEYKIRFKTNQGKTEYKHLDIDVWSKAGGVLRDGVAPTGLLGETFDEDTTQQTATKQNAAAYQVGNLFNTAPTPVPQPAPADDTTTEDTTETTDTDATDETTDTDATDETTDTTGTDTTDPTPSPTPAPTPTPDPMAQLIAQINAMFPPGIAKFFVMFLQLFATQQDQADE